MSLRIRQKLARVDNLTIKTKTTGHVPVVFSLIYGAEGQEAGLAAGARSFARHSPNVRLASALARSRVELDGSKVDSVPCQLNKTLLY